MKPFSGPIIVFIALGICGISALLFLSLSKSSKGNPASFDITVQGHLNRVSISTSMPLRSMQPSQDISSVMSASAVAPDGAMKNRSKSFLPTKIDYKPIINISHRGMILPILNAISNAVLSVDRDLKTKHYRNVEQFNRTIWLESVDTAHATVWKTSPTWKIAEDGTNAVVGAIEAFVYIDAELTQIDPARSFRMEFYPQTGELRDFYWSDKHELFMIESRGEVHGGSINYSKNLGGEKWLQVGWDVEGNIVSSNVYDWAIRGRLIKRSEPEGGVGTGNQ